MKINRRTFIKRMNWALAGAMGILGFTGCEKETPVEYGTPHADFTVKGSVINKATGKPIKGIRVGYDSGYQIGVMYGPPPAPYKPKAHVLTDAKGEFKLTDQFFIGEYLTEDGKSKLPVFVEDIDGTENGLFQPENLQVDFSNAEHSGKPKSWYGGEYTVTMKVELTEIENQ